MPEIPRTVADALTFKHATDGVRALLFYGGSADAGLGSALRVLFAYIFGSLLFGAAFSLARDARAKRKLPLHNESENTQLSVVGEYP